MRRCHGPVSTRRIHGAGKAGGEAAKATAARWGGPGAVLAQPGLSPLPPALLQVDGDIPPRVKKDAHELILDFIRSRPPLKQVPAVRLCGSGRPARPRTTQDLRRRPCRAGAGIPQAPAHLPPCRSPREGCAPYPRSRGLCTRRSWRRSSRNAGCAPWRAGTGTAGVSAARPPRPPASLRRPAPHCPVRACLTALLPRLRLSALHPQRLLWGCQVHLVHQPLRHGRREQRPAPAAPGSAQGAHVGRDGGDDHV